MLILIYSQGRRQVLLFIHYSWFVNLRLRFDFYVHVYVQRPVKTPATFCRKQGKGDVNPDARTSKFRAIEAGFSNG